MLEGFSKAIKSNKYKIILAVLATFFDSISTILALSKPHTSEINPVVQVVMVGETALSNTLLISAIPITALAIILVLYTRASNKKIPSTFIEALIMIQTVAGINNTLVYLGHPTIITLAALPAVFGAYTMKTYMLWKLSKIERKMISKLPT